MKKELIVSLLILAGIGILPMAIQDTYALHILVVTYYTACLAASWNLIGGYTGRLSFAHVAFFGIGAYTDAILNVNYGVSPWLCLLIGPVLAVLFSLLISYPSLRLRGPFFAITTTAFLNIMMDLSIYFRGLTNGTIGISIPFKAGLGNMIFRDKRTYAYLIFILLVVIQATTFCIKHSKLGYRAIALRENQEAAQALGVNPTSTTLILTSLAAAFAGIVGVIYAQYTRYLDPEVAFSMTTQTSIILMAIIGGTGELWGPVVGALLLVPINNVLRGVFSEQQPGLDQLIYGVLLVILILIQPKGILGGLRAYFRRIKMRKEQNAPPMKGEN